MLSKFQRFVYSMLLYVYRFVGILVRLVQPKQETKVTTVEVPPKRGRRRKIDLV